MGSKQLQYIVFVFAVLSLFSVGRCIDWQGYGNLSSSNLTYIWDYINSKFTQALPLNDQWAGLTAYSFACNTFALVLSNYLNQLWDPAWNVFVVPTAAGKDVILYGYAFRYHWMWYNGYTINNRYFTFIIWKDYNCKVWTDFFSSGGLPSAGVNAALQGVNSINPNTDIWGKTKKFMDKLVTQTGYSGNDKAFTIIASEDTSMTFLAGRACIVGPTNYYNSMYSTYRSFNQSTLNSWGMFLILQTR